ncbi:DUF1499 domain-containing protein [Maricaulaceae bacterium NA33B04]|nr:DUF1499 domain-containing protein [Maricaulaceae bacterium NA33B04]
MSEIIRLIRNIVVGLAGAAAIFAPIWFAAAGLGSRFGLWEWQFGLSTMTFGWGPNILFATVGLGGVALLISVISRLVFEQSNAPGVGAYVASVAALIIGGSGLWYADGVRTTARTLPPIHDITTDTANPPQFSAAMVERREVDGASNSVDYASKVDPRSERPLPEVQAEAYPQIQPIVTSAEPELAYRAALGVARELGWRVTTTSDEAMMFEGTAETFWFGFKDDVVVRVTALNDGGAQIDARSTSRVGVSDLGANAARLENFSERLRSSLGDGEG